MTDSSPVTRYRLASDVRFRVIGGEGVVVLQDAGEVLVVNGVAARVLELLDPRRGDESAAQGRGLDELVERLSEEYEAPRDEIEADLREFLEETLAGGVVIEAG